MKKKIQGTEIKVLMYHRLVESPLPVNTKWHYVTVDNFKKQVQLIDRMGYTPITFYDYKLFLNDELTLPKKPIIITFDDGYLDTFNYAIPVLREYNMSAVIFVMGNRHLKRAHWDELNEDDECPLMNDEQIRIAKSIGFEIGAHSMNHLKLSGMTDERIYNEIYQSKLEIEKVLGEPIHTFCYPYGIVNENVRQIASEAGFTFGCGVYSGPLFFGNDLLDIRRLAVNQKTGTIQFLMRLITPYQYAEWVYSKTLLPLRHSRKGMSEHPDMDITLERSIQ